jgi:hypothetical protein
LLARRWNEAALEFGDHQLRVVGDLFASEDSGRGVEMAGAGELLQHRAVPLGDVLERAHATVHKGTCVETGPASLMHGEVLAKRKETVTEIAQREQIHPDYRDSRTCRTQSPDVEMDKAPDRLRFVRTSDHRMSRQVGNVARARSREVRTCMGMEDDCRRREIRKGTNADIGLMGELPRGLA